MTMPDHLSGPVSSLPRTLEMALNLCKVQCTVWARTVIPAADDWAWLTIAYDHDRLWIVQVGPVDPLKSLPEPVVSSDWLELDRCLFEAASIRAQAGVLGLLDELYLGLHMLANASPPVLPESDREAASFFLETFAALPVSSS